MRRIFPRREPDHVIDPLVLDEPADDAAPTPAPMTMTTAEGVPYAAWDHETIVNLSRDAYDARRRALHIDGRTYTHVSDDLAGQWIYRVDR